MDAISRSIKNNNTPGSIHSLVLKDIYGNAGKMEIGLAICKAFVNAQGGEICDHSGDWAKGTDKEHIRGPIY
jgi:hypothetical protein